MTPAEVAGLALACLPAITPARLDRMLAEHVGFEHALEAIRAGHVMPLDRSRAPLPALALAWRNACAPHAVAQLVARAAQRGTAVFTTGSPRYPISEDVPRPPAVLLAEGARLDALAAPRVAIVGTRAATPHGLADAHELGAFLADAGITVVSGLAIGIDAACHLGTLEQQGDGGTRGGPIGVVATGLDIVYPRRHVTLFERVRRNGVIITELGFGVTPDRRRFPVRNRIIAALADVVVVVEATLTGGARITAEHALEYGRPVLAIPGSRRNPSAEGTNALIADGAHPLLQPEDVLVALGLTPGARRGWGVAPPRPTAPLSATAATIHRALSGEAATIDQILQRTKCTMSQVALAIDELEGAGKVTRSQGFFWPR